MTTTINASTSSGLVNTADTSGILQLQTASTAAVTIGATQLVGVGQTSPQFPLHITGASGVNTYATFSNATTGSTATDGFSIGIANGDSNAYIIQREAAALIMYTNATERMRITSGGSVLIGQTTAPSSGTGLTTNGVQYNYSTDGGGLIQTPNGTGLSFYTYTGAMGSETYTERMRIDSNGNLFVGTTTTPSSSNAGIRIGQPGANYWVSYNTGTSVYSQFIFGNANGQVGSITTNGSATAYNTSSDYRLKENIAPMTGALNVVQQLKPVTYNWKSDGSDGQGFIAHELQEVVPDCVTGEKDAVDEEGNPVYQGIDTSFLVATLTAAIQEQQALITQLQADVAALKGAK